MNKLLFAVLAAGVAAAGYAVAKSLKGNNDECDYDDYDDDFTIGDDNIDLDIVDEAGEAAEEAVEEAEEAAEDAVEAVEEAVEEAAEDAAEETEE